MSDKMPFLSPWLLSFFLVLTTSLAILICNRITDNQEAGERQKPNNRKDIPVGEIDKKLVGRWEGQSKRIGDGKLHEYIWSINLLPSGKFELSIAFRGSNSEAKLVGYWSVTENLFTFFPENSSAELFPVSSFENEAEIGILGYQASLTRLNDNELEFHLSCVDSLGCDHKLTGNRAESTR
ncbi:hypothetical protein [Roseibacillus ishigakijimensis]|uniref:Uncharacterized protein n=1 Tax=Roseibacillus ishigakijimensis TaxID=454146 RepID=A0A934VJC3_9BACT|nr:hypothetical protein [Roseibacillus ishigakijimensis]MBK1832444.1 hypothetical protein [Roseibacillus ishigakijimensis]